MSLSDESAELGRAKTSTEGEFLTGLNRLKTVATLGVVLGTWLVLGTVGIYTLRSDVNTARSHADEALKAAAESKADAAANKATLQAIDKATAVKEATDGRLYDSLKALITSAVKDNETEEKQMAKYFSVVDYLDIMRQNGISNKEDFFKNHGFWPSTLHYDPYTEGAVPSPTPAPKGR